MNQIKLEIPVFNTESALTAIKAGADRLEVCSGFEAGGTTPGPGMVSYLRSKTYIPLFVMIRPEGGDFVYSTDELEVMKQDILHFKSLGADGFVFGVLTSDGTVHKDYCKELLSAAGKLPCTFHRAFDVTKDLCRSLEEIIECGFERILTSGGKKSVGEGMGTIKKLQERAKERIIIMPGGGLRPEMIPELAETGYLKEIHASCKRFRQSDLNQADSDISFYNLYTETDSILTIDPDKIEAFRKVIGDGSE